MMSNTGTKRCASGQFAKGQSGNLAGRPKGSGCHETELLKLENDALKLASNTADIIAETLRITLTQLALTELLPLVEEITKAIKKSVYNGHIPPSTLVPLRSAFDDNKEHDAIGDAFFKHVGLPAGCSWTTFRKHYTYQGGRINHGRHADDLASFPPIAEAVAKAKAIANATC